MFKRVNRKNTIQDTKNNLIRRSHRSFKELNSNRRYVTYLRTTTMIKKNKNSLSQVKDLMYFSQFCVLQ